jgi:tRNA pseudouridine55 synthase
MERDCCKTSFNIYMNGFLLLDKPAGLSSAACVARVKHLLGAKKAGHTGTLDPFATGLLPIALGKATKAIPHLPKGRKVYEAVLKLGEETDTLDTEGKVVRQETVPPSSAVRIQEAMAAFLGEHEQVPPLYSAIKVKGRPLYDYARKGHAEGLELKARPVTLFEFSLEAWNVPFLSFKVACSPGAYVRALGRDLAKALGTCGHLVSLRRLESDGFFLKDAVSLEALMKMPARAVTLAGI